MALRMSLGGCLGVEASCSGGSETLCAILSDIAALLVLPAFGFSKLSESHAFIHGLRLPSIS